MRLWREQGRVHDRRYSGQHRWKRRFSVMRCLVAVVMAIAVLEAVIMLWLPFLLPPHAPSYVEATVDSLLLATLVIPVLWVVLIGPLREAADRSEGRYRMLFDQLAEPVLLTDDAGRIKDANPAAQQLLGGSAELIGRSVTEWLEATETLLTADGRRESSVLRADGQRTPVEFTHSRCWVGDEPEHIYVLRDISGRKAAEAELKRTQTALLESSRLAGMSDVATVMLHNVGNVLNSVNVSVGMLSDLLTTAHSDRVSALADFLEASLYDDDAWHGEKRVQLAAYIRALGGSMTNDLHIMRRELEGLRSHVDHIKQIVERQNTIASGGLVEHDCSLVDIVEDAIAINAASLDRHGITVTRQYAAQPLLTTDRHKIIQILVNLITNAKSAILEAAPDDPEIRIQIREVGGNVVVEVADNGDGIAPENAARIFQQGFTTRSDGHGFGLHASIIAAQELGGSLCVESDGVGKGATFQLSLPIQQQELATC